MVGPSSSSLKDFPTPNILNHMPILFDDLAFQDLLNQGSQRKHKLYKGVDASRVAHFCDTKAKFYKGVLIAITINMHIYTNLILRLWI